MITDIQKNEITELLDKFVERYTSQKAAVAKLRNVGEATVINIRKRKWDGISPEMWRTVANQVGYTSLGQWTMVRTQSFNALVTLFSDAAAYNNVFALIAPAGTGKTAVAKWYEQHNRNVFHIVCSEYYNRKVFLSKLLTVMGKDNTGTVAELMDRIIELMMTLENPLIIIDEADKLNDQVLYFFISLYNMLENKAGIVLMGTEYLSKRIYKGNRLKKKGYNEIYSRIGRRFIEVPPMTKKECTDVCIANGFADNMRIAEIWNESDGDMRRIVRAIHREKLRNPVKKLKQEA